MNGLSAQCSTPSSSRAIVTTPVAVAELTERSHTPPMTVEHMQQQLDQLKEVVSTGSFFADKFINQKPSWTLYKDDRLLSDFDPTNDNQNINDWLNKVNECARMYHWDELTTIYLALGKLQGIARVWYDGLKTTQYSWTQWEHLLKTTFPSKLNFGQLFHAAASYKAQIGQDLHEYCFTKLTKLNKLRLTLTDEQIIDVIIDGVQDNQTRLTLRAANCSAFVDFAAYLKNFPSTSRQETGNKAHFENRQRGIDDKRKRNYKESDRLIIKCYLCNEIGHKRNVSPKRRKVPTECSFCHKLGHEENICRKKRYKEQSNSNKKVNFIGNTSDNIYFKRAKINNNTVKCFVDLGSECTLIKQSVALKFDLALTRVSKNVVLHGFSGASFVPQFQCQDLITIDEVSLVVEMYTIDDTHMFVDLLVGHNFTEDISVLIIKTQKQLMITKLPTQTSFATNSNRFTINQIVENPNKLSLENINCGAINEKQRIKLRKLLQNFRSRFCFNLSEIGHTKLAEMKIELKSDKPVVYAPYRLSITEREKVKGMITELLDAKIIRESQSEYASPILLVRKKDGGTRMCVDFRALNKITKKIKYPLPRIEDQLDRLGGYTYFITLDLSSGFYQIPLSEDSIDKTGFVTPDGHFEFLRLPFGLSNAPAVFQRVMNRALSDLAIIYIDDIIIPAKTFRQGIERLELVLKRLQEHNLTLKLSKCSFFQTNINYLGFEISQKGIRPGSEKITAVSKMPSPRNVKQVRQFLGLAGFFRKYIKAFAIIVKPLTKLLKKNMNW